LSRKCTIHDDINLVFHLFENDIFSDGWQIRDELRKETLQLASELPFPDWS